MHDMLIACKELHWRRGVMMEMTVLSWPPIPIPSQLVQLSVWILSDQPADQPTDKPILGVRMVATGFNSFDEWWKLLTMCWCMLPPLRKWHSCSWSFPRSPEEFFSQWLENYFIPKPETETMTVIITMKMILMMAVIMKTLMPELSLTRVSPCSSCFCFNVSDGHHDDIDGYGSVDGGSGGSTT